MTITQTKWVVAQLDKRGYVSRNQALRKYITRLASRITDLKDACYEFNTRRVKGDYQYHVTKRP